MLLNIFPLQGKSKYKHVFFFVIIDFHMHYQLTKSHIQPKNISILKNNIFVSLCVQ